MPPASRQRRKPAEPKEPQSRNPAGDGDVTLDQLTPEARAQLIEELRAAESNTADAARSTAEELAERRQDAIAELLSDRDHLAGCPGGRVECYESRKPARPQAGEPARDVTVVRCIECGGSTVLKHSYTETIAALERATAVPA